MWANFISHCDEGAIFNNFQRKLFHIRRKPNTDCRQKIYQIASCTKEINYNNIIFFCVILSGGQSP